MPDNKEGDPKNAEMQEAELHEAGKRFLETVVYPALVKLNSEKLKNAGSIYRTDHSITLYWVVEDQPSQIKIVVEILNERGQKRSIYNAYLGTLSFTGKTDESYQAFYHALDWRLRGAENMHELTRIWPSDPPLH